MASESGVMDVQADAQLSADPLPFARCYQVEALEKAMKENTIVYLETGSGKTLIAIMLLRSYAYLLRKPSRFIAVFLVPQVVLVSQQAEAIKMHTDLKVQTYWGEMGVDFWDAAMWQRQLDSYEVLVMTPAILLHCLRHSFFKLDLIKVLIMDECHHARGKHPYACIMTEFYHPGLRRNMQVPRIFGMTASPIKSKGGNSEVQYWQNINELETVMNSKVYTCASESVLARYIPFSTPKFKSYEHREIPFALYHHLQDQLKGFVEKYEVKLKWLDIEELSAQSTGKKIQKIFSTFIFCLDDLGLWLALKAAQSISCREVNDLSWGNLDVFGETIVKDFSQDVLNALSACIPSDPNWSVGADVQGDVDAGLITCKVVCLIESLLEYRDIHDIRCIIFVERVITAIVLQSLLSEVLPKYCNWKTKYIAGNNSGLLSQTRKQQNEIVEEFRNGKVNIIVATSILEEGLDVQSCNLVIRFDPSTTVSSFIQSRGRARMQNSDYLLMVKSGDSSTHSRLEKYLSSGETMRRESLRHASLPCEPLNGNLYDEEHYQVASTGAIVTLSSSVELIYFYCSRLPSDSYFKPAPRCDVNEEMNTCTLYLPKSCPLEPVHVQGNLKMLKQMACFEACKQLHRIGALTDNLIPAIVVEEANAPVVGNEPYNEDQPAYFPPELVKHLPNKSKTLYHCYVIELRQNFNYDVTVQDIVLATRSKLEDDICGMSFKLEVPRGSLSVNVRYVGEIHLDEKQVHICRRFQITLLSVLLYHSMTKLREILDGLALVKAPDVDYLLLPHAGAHPTPGTIDWRSVVSVLFSNDNHICRNYSKCRRHRVRMKNGLVSRCMLEGSLVYTPHNGQIYCVTGFFDDMNANSRLRMRDGTVTTYKKYYKESYGIKLCVEEEFLLKGRHIFHVPNCLQRCRQQKERESSNASVELPPELCHVILSPVSVNTLYSFSFAPPVMHHLEALLVAANLKRVLSNSCPEIVSIPTMKVLEALTTKRCQERYHLESLETLGDSFLKYAVCQQLFKTYQSHDEGLLSVKKDKLISNETLCKLGCDRKLPGFIRNEPFDPKTWINPGDISRGLSLCEELLPEARKMYTLGRRKIKKKTVADVVEALLGAYVSTGGENAGLFFVRWLGIEVDFGISPYRNVLVNPEKHINVKHIESLLSYSFRDPSLLVEALTHGSYMFSEIPTCYQRLEFLGDSVLDYLVTIHLYRKHPGLSPGILTDLRSASVNNDCYAQSAIKVGLHKHILHASTVLQKHIADTVNNFEKLSSEFTYGWESETSFPKVLGDIIESLAGAILVDSDYDKERVFQSIRPLLEPLVTPETLRPNPVRELTELCQKEHFILKKPVVSREDGASSVTIEVEAKGVAYHHTSRAAHKKTAKRLASKEVLKSLKENIP
ncbi:endoribonuclease Dicer homolog 2 isoform X3 [Syzygium oleosum]|uniref:endoribonuclease Dicer homolog 2 isoform X3 n=1 Tax=Syzygium oleosum TaxID=219896 RepID=UPI0024B9BC55|nr:endoribonuclease Dicer homolog 2 isoform X3 [Syzygium oleosum]